MISFPSIINKPMKGNDKQKLFEHPSNSFEHFGLGIQVFKIESVKHIDLDRGKQRKMMNNIENPFASRPTPPMPPKKTYILPSLDQARTGMPETQNERRKTLEKKKIQSGKATFNSKPTDCIQKQPHYLSLEKRSNKKSVASVSKPLIVENLAAEKCIVQRHYNGLLSELLDVYENIEQAEIEHSKQLRRLARTKEHEKTQEMKKQIAVLEATNPLCNLPNQTCFGAFYSQQSYQLFQITNYSPDTGFEVWHRPEPTRVNSDEEEDDD